MITIKPQLITAIAIKNLKIKLRSYQTYLYALGFPVLFTFIFYFVFKTIEVDFGYNVFDLAFSSVLIYTASFGTISAAVSLTSEKQLGTLMRLDTTPVGRARIFLGTLLSESIFLIIQLFIIVLLGYGLFQVQWLDNDLFLLFIGFIFVFLFGLSTLGIGIVISAYAKTADSATGLSMSYIMPVLFLSGILIPFESPIVYICPPFWANQIYQQVVILGDNLFLDGIRYNSINIFTAGYSIIPLWVGLLIIIGITCISLYIGIRLFQRKTLT